MEENNIIFCEKCYKVNEPTRTRCVQCGARLNKNNTTSSNTDNTTYKPTTNNVAFKFKLVVRIIQFIGYFGAVVITLLCMAYEHFWQGIVGGIVVFVATWFSKLFYEAIAEGLNLLQEIRDKL